jgi:integrase
VAARAARIDRLAAGTSVIARARIVSSIERRTGAGGTAWRARYRTPNGQQRSKTFDRKVDAQRFLATVESSKVAGSFADPALARLTVSEWSVRWLENQTHLKPSTHERYAGIVREHIEPTWGRVRLSDVSHADVQAWVTRLSQQRSPATVRKVHRVLSLILAMAVKDGRLTRNVAAGVNLPRVVKAERQYLSHEEVERLAAAAAYCGREIVSKHRRLTERHREDYRLTVLLLAYTGMRFGELAALRVGRLDFARRRAVIAESVTLVKGAQVFGTPKGHQRREVPIPPFLLDELRSHVDGKQPGDLVFPGTRSGRPMRAPVFRRSAFDSAAAMIGRPGLHPHELRHTAASSTNTGTSSATGSTTWPTEWQQGAMLPCPNCGLVAQMASPAPRPRPLEARKDGPSAWCPRQDSNLRSRLRRAVLYPLSYGGQTRSGYQRQTLDPAGAATVR